MNNRINNQNCKQLNKLLENYTKKFDGVNFIRFFTCKPGHKCSIIIKTKKETNSFAFVSISKKPKKIENDNSFYYGLHPYFTSKQIIKAIACGVFSNAASLQDFINTSAKDRVSLDAFMEINNDNKKNNFPLFKLSEGNEEYLNSFFVATLVKMASNFGFVFECLDSNILFILSEYEKSHPLLMNIKDNIIRFYCGLQDETIRFLSSNSIYYTFQNNILKLEKEGNSFDNFYNELRLETQLKLLSNNVYYSGVMPRTVKVDFTNDIFNNNVDTYTFVCERTTFATLDLFDNGYISKHPLLTEFQASLNALFKKEDNAQELLLSDYTDQEALISNLNKYLTISPNTHTIAVSGNIETKDKYLILGKREDRTIDSHTFYPSVNGQTEFIDKYPEIYKTSVYEDYPTLDYSNEYRIDFEGEINRETFAELNVQLLDANWFYYGFSFLMINNSANTDIEKRRMHFNILAKNYTKEDFVKVVEAREYAVEKFENKIIIGLKVISFTFKSSFITLLNSLNENWSYIATLTAGIIFLYFGNTTQKNDISVQIQSILRIIGIVITILTLSMKLFDFYQRAKKTRWLHQYIFVKHYNPREHNKNFKQLIKKLNRKITIHSFFNKFTKKKKVWSYHAITVLMIILYYVYQQEDLKKKSNT